MVISPPEINGVMDPYSLLLTGVWAHLEIHGNLGSSDIFRQTNKLWDTISGVKPLVVRGITVDGRNPAPPVIHKIL